MTEVKLPEIKVEFDFDQFFTKRVEAAVEYNRKNNIDMVDKIIVNAGPYRAYSFKYDLKHDKNTAIVDLDFYSGNRYTGLTHTIEEIASVLTREFFEKTLFA